MPQSNLKTILKENLTGAKKVAVLGVGSELRADDIAGMQAAEQLKKNYKGNSKYPKLKVFLGATAPENLTGEIKKFGPSHLLIIDSADTGAKPGTIFFIKPEEVEGVSFSTHMMPLKLMIDYIVQSINCRIIILGIQPKILQFGKPISKEVKQSIRQVSSAITEILSCREI